MHACFVNHVLHSQAATAAVFRWCDGAPPTTHLLARPRIQTAESSSLREAASCRRGVGEDGGPDDAAGGHVEHLVRQRHQTAGE